MLKIIIRFVLNISKINSCAKIRAKDYLLANYNTVLLCVVTCCNNNFNNVKLGGQIRKILTSGFYVKKKDIFLRSIIITLQIVQYDISDFTFVANQT